MPPSTFDAHTTAEVAAAHFATSLDETAALIKAESPEAKLRQLLVDLSSLESVRKAAAEVNSYSEAIDVLINNAAIMAGPYAKTVDGFESQIATNHLAGFLFTNLIRPRLAASAAPRVVNISSNGHVLSDIRYADPGFQDGKTYDKWTSYGASKTANALFSVGLAQRGITSFSLHPGAIWTNLFQYLSLEDQQKMGFSDANGDRVAGGNYHWKTIQEGASTQIVAAFDPTITAESGSYLDNAQLANAATKPYALDKQNAEKLWALSEKMVRQSFL